MNRMTYSLLLYLLLPLILLRLFWRGLVAPAYWKRWGERFGFYGTDHQQAQLWIHTVSVGEFVAAAPLIRALMEEVPAGQILVTTTTPTGSTRVRAEFGDRVLHAYLPYDFPGAVKRFIRYFRPQLGIVMETELWPNLFHRCGEHKMPLLLANVRLSQRSFEGYRRWVESLVRDALQRVSWASLQGEADRKRLVQLGMLPERAEVTGSIKFDLTLPEELLEKGEQFRGVLGSQRPVWIAASTREGEEQYVLEAHRRVIRQIPGALLVLVPRHPERFNGVAKQAQSIGVKVVRRTEGGECSHDTQLYLGDTMGEMLLFYAAADVAYVGGSLVPTGSHNMLEPAALGKPVLFGPHRFNFAEISQMLIDQGAALEVKDSSDLAEAVIDLLQNPEKRRQQGLQGRRVVVQNRGALDRLLTGIRRFLPKS